MRKIAILIAMMLCCCTLLAACNSGDGPQGEQPSATGLSVWSKDSTTHVMQDEVYDDAFKGAAEYRVFGGRGEYEAAQLVITAASDAPVSAYDLEVSDLKCGDAVIDKSYIDVYNEKYIEVSSSPSELSTGTGWYSDALLPFDTAVAYGENKVEAGKNQGIYIETFIPRAAAAGEYKGEFTLTIDGEAYAIPASVTVYDFDVSQESHLQTDWINGLRAFGELDSTAAMTQTYFEAIASFRASTHSMNIGTSDPDVWLENVRKYTNPNLRDENGKPLLGEKDTYLAQINLPSAYDASKGIDYNTFDTYVSRLIAASVQDEYDYLAKSGCYMGFIDEPHYNNTWDKVKAVCTGYETRKAYWADIIKEGDVEDINAKAGTKLTAEDLAALPGGFLTSLEKSMRLVGNYVATPPDERLDNTVTKQFCVPTSSTETAKQLDVLENWTDEETSGNWWYAAGGAAFGNRIDSEPLEQRLSSWYTYNTGAKGYLIWEVAQYVQTTWNAAVGANTSEPCDPYKMALRISNGNGDGFLFYPGVTYGLDTPVASIRAHQYRDASEEYEYFYLLNELYTAAGYSADAVLDKIFDSLYNDNRITEDGSLFAAQREQVINLILLAKKGVFVTDYTEQNAQAKLTVKATGEEKIQTAEGAKAEAVIAQDLTQNGGNIAVSTSSGLTFTLIVQGKARSLFNVSGTDGVTVRGGTASVSESGGLEFAFAVDEETPAELRNFDFTFAAEAGSISAETGSLAATLYNPTSDKLLVECWFVGTDNRTTFVSDIVLGQGYGTLYVNRPDLVRWGSIRTLTGVRFKVLSLTDAQSYTVRCTGVYVTD